LPSCWRLGGSSPVTRPPSTIACQLRPTIRSSMGTLGRPCFLSKAITRQLGLQNFAGLPCGLTLRIRPQWAHVAVTGRCPCGSPCCTHALMKPIGRSWVWPYRLRFGLTPSPQIRPPSPRRGAAGRAWLVALALAGVLRLGFLWARSLDARSLGPFGLLGRDLSFLRQRKLACLEGDECATANRRPAAGFGQLGSRVLFVLMGKRDLSILRSLPQARPGGCAARSCS
jgi:hypothetical protein